MISISNIPKFTSWGTYSVDIEWAYLEMQLKHYQEDDPQSPLQMIPDFQRGHVWTQEQQIRYVEFCLKGGKSSRDILFNCPTWSNRYIDSTYTDFVLVDGLQRITAVLEFMKNRLPVFKGNYIKDFTDHPRVLLRGQRFHVHINDLQTRKEVLNWYLEINSGGVVHSQEELERVRKMLEEEK